MFHVMEELKYEEVMENVGEESGLRAEAEIGRNEFCRCQQAG
jgi:hypothetical protein